MAYLDNFNAVAGETLMHCQRVEHDIKIIFAGMKRGDPAENLRAVGNCTLGEIIAELEALDQSDGHPYFSPSDYRLLKDVRNVRNWLVHRAYAQFMYEREGWQAAYDKCHARLMDFNAQMKKLADLCERVRLDVLKNYGRI